MEAQHVKTVVHMVPYDRDRLPTLHGTIPAQPGEELDAGHIQNYWQPHVAADGCRRGRVLAGRGRLVQPVRAHRAPPALLPGRALHPARRAPLEPAAQRLPRHRAMGRLGLVGRHREQLEDARGADRRRHQLLAQHWPVLGLRHRRLLRQQRADRRAVRALVPVRCLLRLVPRPRPHLVVAPALGLGPERDGAPRDRQPQLATHRGAAAPPASQSELNNPAIEPVAKKYDELRYQLLPYNYTLAWQAARHRHAPHARAVAPLPGDERARGIGDEYLWGRDLLIAPVYQKGATSRDIYLPAGSGTTGGPTIP